MEELLELGKICCSINTIYTGTEPAIQRFFYLDIPTKYQYSTGTTIFILMGRFFDTIIDVDY